MDDIKQQREIASRMLRTLGYTVAAVSSGEEAVDYLESNSADLLVLDMVMDPLKRNWRKGPGLRCWNKFVIEMSLD